MVLAAVAFLATGGLFALGFWLILGLFGLLFNTVLHRLRRCLGCDNWQKSYGIKSANGKRRQVTIMQSIIRNISKVFWLFLILDWLIAIVTAGPDKRQN